MSFGTDAKSSVQEHDLKNKGWSLEGRDVW